ncbi:MAG: RNA-binding protein [Candidatus Zixiibacteriota bacterium]|nr:MAG: RNA-binding protein [candidate division Zixibacteria bacterium]HHI01956.1 RNA-binding protein [candidate division Zixibacteria bacterium]
MKLYVGNLSYDTGEDEIRQAFENVGEVTEVNIIIDRMSGRSKGFGFVEMPDKDEATTAISDLNGKELNGRALNVNEARPRVERDNRGGGGGRRRY